MNGIGTKRGIERERENESCFLPPSDETKLESVDGRGKEREGKEVKQTNKQKLHRKGMEGKGKHDACPRIAHALSLSLTFFALIALSLSHSYFRYVLSVFRYDRNFSFNLHGGKVIVFLLSFPFLSPSSSLTSSHTRICVLVLVCV